MCQTFIFRFHTHAIHRTLKKRYLTPFEAGHSVQARRLHKEKARTYHQCPCHRPKRTECWADPQQKHKGWQWRKSTAKITSTASFCECLQGILQNWNEGELYQTETIHDAEEGAFHRRGFNVKFVVSSYRMRRRFLTLAIFQVTANSIVINTWSNYNASQQSITKLHA